MDQEDEVEPWYGRPRRRFGHMPLWQELPLLLVVAFGIAVLVRTFLLQAFFIPSGSMEETLIEGDRVLVNKVVYHTRDPRRGEIVVFRGTDAWAPAFVEEPDQTFLAKLGRTIGDLVGIGRPSEKDYIKRVIGVPGDRVSCCDHGRVTVNGIPLDEPYVVHNSPDVPPRPGECNQDRPRSRRFGEVLVPPGQLFVMGDHRFTSYDARCQGTVPIDNVIGRAIAIVWPYSRWETLSVPATFDSLAKPAAARWQGPEDTFAGRQPAGPYPAGRHLAGTAVVLPALAALLDRRVRPAPHRTVAFVTRSSVARQRCQLASGPLHRWRRDRRKSVIVTPDSTPSRDVGS